MADTSSVSITLSNEQKAALSKAFGPFQNKKQEHEAMQRFASLALAAFTDWITGAKRYRSLTEQYIDWIEEVYGTLLLDTEAPSVDRIYNSLNMPYGQAAYIARVLASKTLTHWRDVAQKDLLGALSNVAAAARKYITEGDSAQQINIEISQVAAHELLRVCSARRRLSRSYLMPRSTGAAGDFRFFSIPASTVVDLVDNANW